MTRSVDDLARSLLYDGNELYLYGSANAEKAASTPFGTVYPPAYARLMPTLYDCLQIQCVVEYEPDATVEGNVLFLFSVGAEYRVAEQRLRIEHTPIDSLEIEPGIVELDLAADQQERSGLKGEAKLSAEALASGQARVTLRVENRTEIPAGEARDWDRPQALAHSLVSTHAYIKVKGGRFVSPLEMDDERISACKQINSWPVLATEDDDAVLGAVMMLPDYPKIAPERLRNNDGGLHTAEPSSSAGGTTSFSEVQSLLPEPRSASVELKPMEIEYFSDRHQSAPPKVPDEYSDAPGAEEVEVDGRYFKRGDHVVLHLLKDSRQDAIDHLLNGKSATIERILIDYDGTVHFGVTMDGDPGRQLLRETNRFMYFFADEVEVLPE